MRMFDVFGGQGTSQRHQCCTTRSSSECTDGWVALPEVFGSFPCICQRRSHISTETTEGNDIHQSFVMSLVSFKCAGLNRKPAVTLNNAVQLDLNCYLYLIMVLMPVGYFNIHFPEKSRVGCPPTFLMDVSCLDFLLFLLGLIFQLMHSCPVS